MIDHIYTISQDGRQELVVEANSWQELIEDKSFFYMEGYGIRWTSNGKVVTVNEDGYRIFAVPTIDLKQVIVVYPYSSVRYSPPENAVIYSAEGSIQKQLSVPKLISVLGIDKENFMDNHGIYDVHFMSVSIRKFNEIPVVCFDIGIMRDWMESRMYSVDKDVFGDCLASGRV